jgi:hypothetical protein
MRHQRLVRFLKSGSLLATARQPVSKKEASYVMPEHLSSSIWSFWMAHDDHQMPNIHFSNPQENLRFLLLEHKLNQHSFKEDQFLHLKLFLRCSARWIDDRPRARCNLHLQASWMRLLVNHFKVRGLWWCLTWRMPTYAHVLRLDLWERWCCRKWELRRRFEFSCCRCR